MWMNIDSLIFNLNFLIPYLPSFLLSTFIILFFFNGNFLWKRMMGTRRRISPLSIINYNIDNFFSSTRNIFFAFFFFTGFKLLFDGLLIYGIKAISSDEKAVSFTEAIWLAWCFIFLDNDLSTSDPKKFQVFLRFLLKLSGYFTNCFLTALLFKTLSQKIEEFKKGYNDVVENNHILIIGWSGKMRFILHHLSTIYGIDGQVTIVILSEMKEEDMENEIRGFCLHATKTRVICRSGFYFMKESLEKVSIATARSIIVLAELADSLQSDARANAIVLGIMSFRETIRDDVHIVVEIKNRKYEDIIKEQGIYKGKKLIVPVVTDEIIMLMIQCAGAPGLIQVWKELLDLKNTKFYRIKCNALLEGKKFSKILFSFPEAIPIAIVRKNEKTKTKISEKEEFVPEIILNPPHDDILKPDDEIFVIVDSNSNFETNMEILDMPMASSSSSSSFLPSANNDESTAERILICGNGYGIDDKIHQLHDRLPLGSEVWVLAPVPKAQVCKRIENYKTKRIKVECRFGNPLLQDDLDSLGNAWVNFDSILVLFSGTEYSSSSVRTLDDQTQFILGLIRNSIKKRSTVLHKCLIVCEMIERPVSNINLQSGEEKGGGENADYIFTNDLISKVLALASKDALHYSILNKLFQAQMHDPKIMIKEFNCYALLNEKINFYEIMERGMRRGGIVIGYKKGDDVIMNPKDKQVEKYWEEDTKFVVLGHA